MAMIQLSEATSALLAEVIKACDAVDASRERIELLDTSTPAANRDGVYFAAKNRLVAAVMPLVSRKTSAVARFVEAVTAEQKNILLPASVEED